MGRTISLSFNEVLQKYTCWEAVSGYFPVCQLSRNRGLAGGRWGSVVGGRYCCLCFFVRFIASHDVSPIAGTCIVCLAMGKFKRKGEPFSVIIVMVGVGCASVPAFLQ